METKDFDYKLWNEHKKTPFFWGRFEPMNSKHMYILSLLRQIGWETLNQKKGRSYADLERFGSWLQSEKAPVRKPLKKMDQAEVSKTITALEGMVKSRYK